MALQEQLFESLTEGNDAETSKASIGPRNDVERHLVDIWEQVLGVHPVGVRDNFFDLGGHSLLAVTLFSEVKREFNISLPLSILSDAPTVEQLAHILLEQGKSVSWTSLVKIQAGGRKLPLYLISGAGGNVVRFRDLARYLGEDQPIFALQPPGLDGEQTFMTSVEELSAHFIAEIRKDRPLGPYHLVGYSFGALVAFEMARQLKTAGVELGLVGLLDIAEWRYAEQLEGARSFADRKASYLNRLRRLLSGENRLSYLKRGMQKRMSMLFYRLAKSMRRPLPQSIGTIEDINMFAALQYSPGCYEGRLTLLRTKLERENMDPQLGWGRIANEVAVLEIPGDHDEITSEPHVQVLAAKLSACLEENMLTIGKNWKNSSTSLNAVRKMN